MKKLLAVLTAAALTLGVTASAASAHPTPTPDCEGETYAVVAAEGDAAMAELVASWQALDTDCVVAPADAKRLISTTQETVVLGGTKAVPLDAIDGLNVIVRLSGADRLATAKAVIAWIDKRNQRGAKEASTGPGNAQDQRNGYSEMRFTVGIDLVPGVWEFTSRHTRNIFARKGSNCYHSFGTDDQRTHHVDINGEAVQGDEHIYSGAINERNTYRFALLEGDIVTLQAEFGQTCRIVWVRE